jgi:hypothetical protein
MVKLQEEIVLNMKKKFMTVIINLDNVKMELLSNKKVNCITGKKTTSKSDIILYNNNIPIPISIKMSNKGTQLQIISLNKFLQYLTYKNISCNIDVVNVWKKYLGIVVPNDDELKHLNINRTNKCKNKKRYWLNELSIMEQLTIELFIYINQYALLEFCLKNGMCLEQSNQAELFLLSTPIKTTNHEM